MKWQNLLIHKGASTTLDLDNTFSPSLLCVQLVFVDGVHAMLKRNLKWPSSTYVEMCLHDSFEMLFLYLAFLSNIGLMCTTTLLTCWVVQ